MTEEINGTDNTKATVPTISYAQVDLPLDQSGVLTFTGFPSSAVLRGAWAGKKQTMANVLLAGTPIAVKDPSFVRLSFDIIGPSEREDRQYIVIPASQAIPSKGNGFRLIYAACVGHPDTGIPIYVYEVRSVPPEA